MTRKSSFPWAPTSMPFIRDHWIHAEFDRRVTEDREEAARLRNNGQPRAAARLDVDIAGDVHARTQLAQANLYWVTRDMVDYALAAAKTLPEWTPRAAMPSSSGLLCWAKPAAGFAMQWGAETPVERVPADAMAWYFLQDGTLQILGASRADRSEASRRQLRVDTPFVIGNGGSIDADLPLAIDIIDERNVPAVLLLGAAWLLMAQTTVSTNRRIPPPEPPGAGNRSFRDAPPEHSAVSLIDLRRLAAGPAEHVSGNGRSRTYTHQWWVDGHWRQQACGPGRSYRKPVWIAPHIKGPEGTPLANERVHVLRR
ncbi:hypothetical protein ACORG1_33320 (plasmid) [Mycobacterium sp. TJFP1]